MKQTMAITAGFWIAPSLFFSADGLHRLRAAAPAAGGGGVHPPRLPRLLPGGALVGQARRRCRVLLAPVLRTRLKEWAYAGFAIDSGLGASSPTSRWGTMPVRSGAGRPLPAVLWGSSYFFFRKLTPGEGRAVLEPRPTRPSQPNGVSAGIVSPAHAAGRAASSGHASAQQQSKDESNARDKSRPTLAVGAAPLA